MVVGSPKYRTSNPLRRPSPKQGRGIAILPKPLFLLFNKLEMIRILILEFQRITCTIVDTIC